jgi:hypothetical protein
MAQEFPQTRYQKTSISGSFVRDWSLNAPGSLFLAALVVGIGAFFLPLNLYLVSACLGVGADAIDWIMPLTLFFTSLAVGIAVGHFVGKRQQQLLERHLSLSVAWKSATQYGVMMGFAACAILLIPLFDAHHMMGTPFESVCLQVCAILLPLYSLAMGLVQAWVLKRVVDGSWRWVGIHVVTSSIVGALIYLSVSHSIESRVLGAIFIAFCLWLLHQLIESLSQRIITYLAGIAFTSTIMFLFLEDLLLLFGITASAVETAAWFIYILFLIGALSIFKANILASALVEILDKRRKVYPHNPSNFSSST